MHRNAERIRALVECPKTPFTADDVPFLEGLSDERLATFETPTPEPTAAASKTLTEDEFLQSAPQSIRDIVSAHKVAEAAKRKTLIAGLSANQQVYTEAELTAMPTDQLAKLSQVARVEIPAAADYSGAGAPRAAQAATVEPPDPWAAAIAARKGA